MSCAKDSAKWCQANLGRIRESRRRKCRDNFSSRVTLRPPYSSPFVNMRAAARFLNQQFKMAATALSVGQKLTGKVSSYKVLERFQKDRDVWAAM